MPSRRSLWRLALVALLPAGVLCARENPVAVFSQVYNGYTRTKLPDGTFRPEAYTFGNGGFWDRPIADKEREKMTFLFVARSIAGHLEKLNYVPARSTDEVELLILVFWGTTQGTRDNRRGDLVNLFSSTNSSISTAGFFDAASGIDPNSGGSSTSAATGAYDSALWQIAMGNRERDELDDRNARILGYTELLSRARFASHMTFAQDIIGEVGDNRYYVVLQAYDFKTALVEKKLKPMWTARLSVLENRNDFAESLDRMVTLAMPYLGQDSRGLRRDVTREGRVELGPLKVIETFPDK